LTKRSLLATIHKSRPELVEISKDVEPIPRVPVS